MCAAAHSAHAGQYLQVALHLLGDARALDFDDDVRAILERGCVGLTDGGGRERLRVEFGEQLLRGLTELSVDDLADLIERHRRGGVLQLRELRDVLWRHQIGTRAERLAELDERGAQLAQRHPQMFSPGVGGPAGRMAQPPALERDQASQPDPHD